MVIEIVKLIIYLGLIIVISKYILVKALRRLAKNLNLSVKVSGNISGYATSAPEFLTVVTSSINGLNATGIFNILSSNIINLIQYIVSMFIHKNTKYFKNKAIKMNIIMVTFTIIIPLVFVILNKEINIFLLPFFIILFLFFKRINTFFDEKYVKKLENKDKKINLEKEKNNKINFIKILRKNKKVYIDIIILILIGIVLYFIGDFLGDTLVILSVKFKIPQWVIGVILGISTSIPELITFLESQKYHKKEENDILGVLEATNNLFTSNILNLFIIQTIGVILAFIF